MNTTSSGCYVIDSEYNVINVNEQAKTLYPNLEIGKKCYHCLMKLDEPCGPCPVANGRKGPATYTDPIRNISEIVDAVEIDIEGSGRCHALVFSTIANEEAFAATLPTSAEELKNLALVKALTVDYYDVFSVNLQDGSMTLYRHNGQPLEPDSIYKQITSYEEGIEDYISRHVYHEDQKMMREKCSLDYLRENLKETESFVIHYRAIWQEDIHYFYRKVVRIGDADSFENFVAGVACEDEEVRIREQQIALKNNLRKVEYSTATGLLTKEAFFIYGDNLLKKYPDKPYDFSILRIENLGSINHQYGRLAGDRAVQLIGVCLKKYETEKACIAYFGDGIFGCLIENTSAEVRKNMIQRFQDEIIEQSDIKNFSFKWTEYKQIRRDASVEEIYGKITYIISTIRQNMPEHYVEFDQAMMEHMAWDLTIEKNFKKALENGEFIAWYQPKYSVHTQEIIGAEALVRWKLPNGEMISPARFIPVLENCGMINLLDEEIFRQACEMTRQIKNTGHKSIPISVNLSRASIFTKDISRVYSEIADSYDIEHHEIPIEITESAAVRATMIKEFASSLIERGFALHMDDFGAGYSSLASLQTIPFESIKLDKTLIDFIGKRSGESLLKHTIAFAKESGMSIIAEGVETLEQYMFLKFAGCDAIQGYYFSKPIRKEELLKRLEK